ncbi:MAG: hypothetical protein KKB50_05115 [Planctomycetes bacterium]|nr:hypothetical protein [Planctomycetota bacterium]
MADSAVPDDRAAMAAMEKLRKYNTLKKKQLKSAGDKEPPPVDDAFVTVETWANDQPDDGEAWAQKRELEANQQTATAKEWDERVRVDEKQAAEEAQARAEMDIDEVKKGLYTAMDNYKAALKEQADNDQPWAKQKLTEVAQEHAEAKRVIDAQLEPALDGAARANAQRRQKNKVIAEKANERAEVGQQWKQDYGDQPGKYPQGQRADTKKALEHVCEWADEATEQVQPFGARGAPHVEALKKTKEWASSLGERVDADAAGPQQDPKTKAAKEQALTGVEEGRACKQGVEEFMGKIESESNEAMDVYTRWKEHNNRLAEQWIKSDSAEHRKWAQAWLDSQK